MSIAPSLLPEFDQEMAITRTLLERVPAAAAEFRPHPKSMTLARLAGHVAEMPSWVLMTCQADELDLAPPPGQPAAGGYRSAVPAELLAKFDGDLVLARRALAACDDAAMQRPWTLRSGAQVHFTLPRLAVLRTFALNHMVHHRAQLGVYLRMQDVPLPSVYGPTADSDARF